MSKIRLPQCPYCGKKVNPIVAWTLRTQGEFICPACGGVSNIAIDPAAKALGVLAAVLGVVLFGAGIVMGEGLPIVEILVIMAPFVLYSILSTFFVRLKKPILRRREKPAQRPARPASSDAGRNAARGRAAPSGTAGASVNRAPQPRPAARYAAAPGTVRRPAQSGQPVRRPASARPQDTQPGSTGADDRRPAPPSAPPSAP